MNPATNVSSAPLQAHDAARAVSNLPTPAPAPLAASTPNLVASIPMHNEGIPHGTAPVHEDSELDKIMQDAGKDIKDIGKRPPKKHFFGFKKKQNPEAKFQAQPIPKGQPVAQSAVHHQPSTPPPPMSANPQVNLHPKPEATKAFKAIEQPKSPKPVLVIFMTILVTSALVALAFYSYSNNN